MILVDSSVWIDFFNGRTTRETDELDRLLSREILLTGDLILAEVLQGFRRDADIRRAEALLGRLAYADMVGRDVAILAARHYRILRQRGVTVRKTIDVLIATFCIRHDLHLLHADRDFEPIRDQLGLKTIQP